MLFAVPHDEEDGAHGHGAGQKHLPGQHLTAQQPAQKDADDRHHIFIGDGRGDGDILQQPEIAGIGDDRTAGAHPGKGHDHRPVFALRVLPTGGICWDWSRMSGWTSSPASSTNSALPSGWTVATNLGTSLFLWTKATAPITAKCHIKCGRFFRTPAISALRERP